MTQQYEYRVFCCTENTFVDSWLYQAPVTCPNNYKHKIDSNQIYLLDQRYIGQKNVVSIQNEDTPTQGNYRYECITYEIGSNSVQSFDKIFPYPINLLSVKFRTSELHRGDIIKYDAIPPPPIGLLTSNVSIGDSNFYVDNTTLSILNTGYHMLLTNDDLGEVFIKNTSSNLICTQYGSSNTYSIGDVIHMDVNMVKNIKFTEPDWYSVGSSKVTGNYLPQNVTLRFIYTNSNLQPKEVVSHLEYLY